MIVEIAGIDGSGKTTIINALKGRLIRSGLSVSSRSPKSQNWLLLYAVAQAKKLDFFKTFGEDAIHLSAILDLYFQATSVFGARVSEGHIFLIDRYILSHLAEAIFSGCGNIDGLKQLSLEIPAPQISICLKIGPNIALERINSRSEHDSRVHQHGLLRLEGMESAINDAANLVPYEVTFFGNETPSDQDNIIDTLETGIKVALKDKGF
ncbi:AAA family ATPase [Rhizobium leguminosarum]|uniref:AAA family ATPase n=1 Tax=Rhizobium leguminosarum TaxID=384 RepID=UPI001C94EDA9|nr:AAA family ATPase [Rhizobium leguminosarum]MBY5370569.1 hypothetical protein [Rhizobium leguminosarum]